MASLYDVQYNKENSSNQMKCIETCYKITKYVFTVADQPINNKMEKISLALHLSFLAAMFSFLLTNIAFCCFGVFVALLCS